MPYWRKALEAAAAKQRKLFQKARIMISVFQSLKRTDLNVKMWGIVFN